jgi:uncharacterized membrane protein YkvA (DUF1232 family)
VIAVASQARHTGSAIAPAAASGRPPTGGATALPGAERVPGPPRGRRHRLAAGDVLRRVQAARDAEEASGLGVGALLRVAWDVILLLKDLAADPRVPRSAKVFAGLAVAYLLSPIDLVPDFIPGLGQADDLGVAVLAVRRLLHEAGFAVIYELWRGSDEGLALVLTLAGVEE